MTAGLPGTGIGGLFYLLLVFLMPCLELYNMVRGRSNPARWRAIGFFLSLTAGIIAMTYAMAWAISQIVTAIAHTMGVTVGNGQGYRVLASTTIFLSLGSLAGVLLAVHLLRLTLWLISRKPRLPMVSGPVAGPAAAAQ